MELTHHITMNHILIVAALFSAVFAIISLIFSIKAMIEIRSLQQSTHSVTWMPADNATKWSNDDKYIKELDEQAKELYRESGF